MRIDAREVYNHVIFFVSIRIQLIQLKYSNEEKS